MSNARARTRPLLRRFFACISPLLLMHAAATVAHARQGAGARGDAVANFARTADAVGYDFALAQLRNPRVMQARLETRFGIKRLFRERGITYPAAQVFIRIFKRERTLELWVRPHDADRFVLLKQYMICALTGDLGPKRVQGDKQTPEGFYEVDLFNPTSEYHLSLHVDYPNRSDRLRGANTPLGGDIFIHGGCETAGCIAVTDEAIKELYWIGVEARAGGQQRIPVHIFPARLTNEELGLLARAFSARPELVAFWTSLQPGFQYFERTRQLPPIRVDANGHYGLLGEIEEAPAAAARGR